MPRGIRALNDRDLRALGRLHSVSEAKHAFSIARETFDRVSFDLIYARQDQSRADWEAELSEALAMAADHLSLYQLTIEDGTAFGERHRRGGLKGLPDDDLAADLYQTTQELCDAAGMPAYEVSNHARPGAESRHNLIYWRCGDYAGIGPGAHGRLTLDGRRLATDTPLSPDAWLSQVEQTGNGEHPREPVEPEDQATEYLLMALRVSEGVDRARYRALEGSDLPQGSLDRLAELKLLTLEGDRVAATRTGRAVLNALLRELLTPA